MAGNYPDPTTWRMPLDIDGSTLVFIRFDGTVEEVPASDIQKLNSEINSTYVKPTWGGNGVDYNLAVIFPEKRDIDGWFIAADIYRVLKVEVSADTTNGQDGTWTTVMGTAYQPTTSSGQWRAGLTANTSLAVQGIRFFMQAYANGTNYIYSTHLWGEIAPAQNLDRLDIWHPSLDQKLGPAALDWGDTPRSSSETRTFRVKNLSLTKNASNIRVNGSGLSVGNPSVVAEHVYSIDGVNFFSQVNIGSLGPGVTSGLVYVRRITPSNAQLGLFTLRVKAQADTFA